MQRELATLDHGGREDGTREDAQCTDEGRGGGVRYETADELDGGCMPRCLDQRGGSRRRGDEGVIRPFAATKFSQDQDVKCLLSAVETGDPTTGPSPLILKASSGCVVPWHFHTAEEQLIVISGTVLAEMINHQPTRLGPGGFAMMGGRMPHQFTCQRGSACLMIVAFDRAYDIFWGKGG